MSHKDKHDAYDFVEEEVPIEDVRVVSPAELSDVKLLTDVITLLEFSVSQGEDLQYCKRAHDNLVACKRRLKELTWH